MNSGKGETRAAVRLSPARTTETPKPSAAPTPAPGLEAGVLRLQRAAGNRAIGSLLGAGGPAPIRRCAACEGGQKCDACRRRERTSAVRRSPATGGGASAGGQNSPHGAGSPLHSYVAGSVSGGQALPAPVRTSLEAALGQDLSPVRIHTDAAAGAAADTLGARAFALSNSIWFGRGEYQPDTPGGRFLLAHEIAHTLQQRGHTPALQESLIVGGVSDPAERAADLTALAALRPGPAAPPGRSAPVIRRTARTGRNADEVIVDNPDGSRYVVTRTRTLTQHTRTEFNPPRVRPGINKDKVWLEISWCRGTKGDIQIGANVPQQAAGLLKQVVDSIRNGGGTNDVWNDIKNTQLTPYVNLDLLQSGQWHLGTGVNVTVGRGGVTAGGGSVTFSTPDVKVDVSVSAGPAADQSGRTDTRVTGNVTIPLDKPKTYTCPTHDVLKIEQETTYSCVRERDVPPTTQTLQVPFTRTDTRLRHVYFQYATAAVNAGNAANTQVDQPSTATELAALTQDINEGFRVSNITAYTSPEGPTPPGPGFIGNADLSRRRAEKAVEVVRQACAGRPGCFVSDAAASDPTAAGELYTLADATTGREVEGRPLARHAAEEFIRNEIEAPPPGTPGRDPRLGEDIGKQRTPEAQARIVYPFLRRADIHLTHTVSGMRPQEVPVPGRTDRETLETCPEDVLTQAKSVYEATTKPAASP